MPGLDRLWVGGRCAWSPPTRWRRVTGPAKAVSTRWTGNYYFFFVRPRLAPAGDLAAFQFTFLTCLGCVARRRRPRARRALSTFRPAAVAIRERKPCTRWRRRTLG